MRKGLLIGIAVAALLIAMGGDNGGFFPQSWRWTSLALLSSAGAGLVLRERVVLSRRDGVAVAALSGLALWMLLSRAWSAVPALAVPEAERALVYVAALLALLVLLDAELTAWALAGLVAASVVLSAWGLADFASSPDHGRPLVGPLGYANGAGALAAVGAVVTVGFATETGSGRLRGAVLAPTAVLAATLVLAKSAGAWLALLVGLLVLAVPHRRRIGTRAVAGGGALVLAGVVVWLALGHPAGGLTSNIRWSYWRVALDDYRAHPVLGSGAGSFGRYWEAHKTTHFGALDAHSLYVESLAELGPLGLALVLTFVATVLRAVAVRLKGLTSVAAAGFVTFAVHAGIDWDWELPVVTLAGVTLAGVALVRADRDTASAPASSRVQFALAAVAVAFAVLALVRLKTAGP